MRWKTTYLETLRLKVEKPSLLFLEKITTSHLNQFPFENISKLLKQDKEPNIPSPSELLHNRLIYHTGGTCYTLNANLFQLLKALKFNCRLLQVGGVHLAILVFFADEMYYVDCGATAPNFKPLLLENKKIERAFEQDQVFITPTGDQSFEYKRYLNGAQSGSTWSFRTDQLNTTIEDFTEIMNDSFAEDAPFMTILRCHLYQLDQKRSVSLVNDKFTIRFQEGGAETVKLHSIEEVEKVISQEFRLPNLPIRQAIEGLKKRGHDIFAH
ncbi:arylamine N-acetyltransferase [Shouchella patagoniensis]|uniref:arylamine N-acetyltransferase n=1 Tax=Shouchella patagoniensis TaxID=228576 RepID=UPI0009948F95|nr:arylamine N-acetyltransferase [Shouchella patagoniensis]